MAEVGETRNRTGGKRPTSPALRWKELTALRDAVLKVRDSIAWRKLATAMITVAIMALVVALFGTLGPGIGREGGETPYAFDSITPTHDWANFYSLESVLDGRPLPVGTVITAVDPQGVVCGKFLVTNDGRYGLMPVYGDDPSTEADEGAVPGDRLEFILNDIQAAALGPDEPVWTAMGDLRQVNLTASTHQ